MIEEVFKSRCNQLAEIAASKGESPVGSILVFNHEVIGEGIESTKALNDVTQHAEIRAIRDAIAQGHKEVLDQSILYSTHEPCVMCSYSIRHYKIKEVCFGQSVPHIGGATSAFNALVTDQVPSWPSRPKITRWVD